MPARRTALMAASALGIVTLGIIAMGTTGQAPATPQASTPQAGTRQTATALRADDDIAAVIACAKTLPDEKVGVHDAECMEGVLTTMLTSSTLGEVHDILIEATTHYPPLELSCHTSAYRAARATHQRIEDLGELVRPMGAMATSGCKGGLARGAVAAWVDDGADKNRLKAGIDSCETASRTLDPLEREAARGRCAGAIGVGLQDAYHDPTLCGLFADPQPHGCAGAFLQEVFQPLDSGTPTPQATVEDITSWCTHWPSSLDVTDCYAGAVFAIAYDYTSAMFQARTGSGSLKAAYDALVTAVKQCRQLDPGGTCESNLIRRLPRTRGDIAGAPLEHCQAFQAQYAAHCRSQLEGDPLGVPPA